MNSGSNTEQRILDAAEEVFHQKGFDGARMQEIAEQAGINKGLLHYYFKTKDKLFEAIFSTALNRIISRIHIILKMEISLDEKIGMIVDQYMNLLIKNPHLPRFVLHELNKNPDYFITKHLDKDAKRAFELFANSVQIEADNKKIKAIDARQLFMNMMSLLIFPFVGRPLLQAAIGLDNNQFKELMSNRKEVIKDFIYSAIKV